jgi:hypothetical protein
MLAGLAAAAALTGCAPVAGFCQTKPAPDRPSDLQIQRDPVRKARIYSITEGDCRIVWTVFGSAPNRGIVQERSVCRSPLSEQLPARSRLLAAVMSDAPERPHTYVWGRLTPDQPRDDFEMAFRLALAAHHSPSWDSKLGRPRSGQVNALIVQLANRNMIYPELNQLFNARGLELRFADAEKVLILSAGRLSFFDRLKAAGVDATESLPFDCLAYFAISKAPEK